jgi:hypothetical protein
MATSPTATSHRRSLHARTDHPLRFPCRSLLCRAQETASCLYEATDQAVVLPKPGVSPKSGNATTVPLNDPIAPDIETLLLLPGRPMVADLARVIELAPGTELLLDVVNRDGGAPDLEIARLRTRTVQLAGSERLALGVGQRAAPRTLHDRRPRRGRHDLEIRITQ